MFVDFENAINTAIRKIRVALNDSAVNPTFVETLPRLGYRFIYVPEQVGRPVCSLAVLPLQNLSGDPDKEYFSDGLTDSLITNLAKIRALKVISRTSVMQYKQTQKPISEIAKDLDVDAVVEGSVVKEGSRVRVTVQLIDADTDHHLWAENYEREMMSVLALQAQVAREIAREIQVIVTPQEVQKLSGGPLVDSEAFDAYLRGIARTHEFTPESLRAAYSYFQAAVAADSGSALAHSGLAEALFFSVIMGLAPPREIGPKGLAAAERAVELDGGLAQAHVCLGLFRQYYQWNWEGAEEEYRKALDLNPGNANACIHYALLLTCMGRYIEAAQYLDRGLELDPLNLMFQHISGMQMLWCRKSEQAIEQLGMVLTKAPNMHMTYVTLWAILNLLGREDEAFKTAVNAWSVVGDQELVRVLEEGYGNGGYREAMRRAALKMADRAKVIYVPPHIISLFFDAAGDTESVFTWLEEGFEQREQAMAYFNRKPYSDRVRSDPRYHMWLERLGLPS
jgi:TolB-like protein